jgi:hypothetical protein
MMGGRRGSTGVVSVRHVRLRRGVRSCPLRGIVLAFQNFL